MHPFRWHAETQLDPVFDVAIPTALFVYNAELKYGSAITKTEPKSAARAFALVSALAFVMSVLPFTPLRRGWPLKPHPA